MNVTTTKPRYLINAENYFVDTNRTIAATPERHLVAREHLEMCVARAKAEGLVPADYEPEVRTDLPMI